MITSIIGIFVGGGISMIIMGRMWRNAVYMAAWRVMKMVVLGAHVVVAGIMIRIWRVVVSDGYYQDSGYVVDSVGVYLVLLTVLMVSCTVVMVWRQQDQLQVVGLLVVMEGMIIGVFTVWDILWFYIYFEGVLIPMYMMVGMYGSRERKVKAGRYLLVYTVVGSICLLVGIMVVYVEMGTMDYGVIRDNVEEMKWKEVVWLLYFMGMMVKIPMVPVHLWLIEAHVEASTEGSVVLAALLLKLGTYGVYRYNVELLGGYGERYVEVIMVLGVVGIIYTGLSAVRQTDVKRIIAYGSIGHMALVVMGLVVNGEESYQGAVYQMVSHGLVAGGLFMVVGMVYKRVGSREVREMGGIGNMMPMMSVGFFILVIANMGVPGTSAFIGELLLLLGVGDYSIVLGGMSAIGMVVGSVYSLYMYGRMINGNVRVETGLLEEVNVREGVILLVLVMIVVSIGIVPGVLVM